MPLFTREFVSCKAQPSHPHLYDDPVMLSCSHVFCRLCCLALAQKSKDKSILCPSCSFRINFDNPNRFVENLISHGTLACMVKQYLREANQQPICCSCQKNFNPSNSNEKSCRNCQNETMKKKILERIADCDRLIANQKIIELNRVQRDIKDIYEIIDQREKVFMESIDRYQGTLDNLLEKQEEANETNARKHQSIDIQAIAALVEPRLNALKRNKNFPENIQVEKEINRLNIEADRQLRLLKHRSDTVPILTPVNSTLDNHIFGELLFKSLEINSETSQKSSPRLSSSPSSSSSSSSSSMVNATGNTSLQSIPVKLPMWTVDAKNSPNHICIHPLDRSILIFSCNSTGVVSLLTYVSPVTYDSPRYIRSFNLFPQQTHLPIQSFLVFNRFIFLHLQERNQNGLIYFFSHEGSIEHTPIELAQPVSQYLADDDRLWAINSLTHTVYSHPQPTYTHEIVSVFSKIEEFISFPRQSNFLPIRMSINQQSLALLSHDRQQVFIYNKQTRERIFTSHFSVGHRMSIRDIGLFPQDNSLLLKFDLLFVGHVKRSLIIHFDTKNQSVGRIEERNCLGVAIGPNKEILVGFKLRSGIIRCYM